MRVVILCPYGTRTGGPEACHQLSDALIRQGMAAEMWYLERQDVEFLASMARNGTRVGDIDLNVMTRENPIAEYSKYQFKPFTHAKAGESLVFVFPEVYLGLLQPFAGLPVVIWWLSVDNAFGALSTINLNVLRQPWIKHVAQSVYAAEFVKTLGLQAEMLTDYTVVAEGQPLPLAERPLRVAVNAGPKVISDLPRLEGLLRDRCPALEFVPIKGMSREDVYQAFASSRLFIDLGTFPGKDRMAREALLLGANIIVAKAGAGAWNEDVPIPECYRVAIHDMEAVARLAAHMIQVPESHAPHFDTLRRICREERTRFFGEVVRVFGPLGVSRPQVDAAFSAPSCPSALNKCSPPTYLDAGISMAEVTEEPQIRRPRILVLSRDRADSACRILRVTDPLMLLGEHVELIELPEPVDETSLEDGLSSCDGVLVQRAFAGSDSQWIVDRLWTAAKLIIYETDDLLDLVPANHPEYAQIAARIEPTLEVLRRAQLVIVSTEQLRQHYLKHNPNVVVFRNFLSQQRWSDIEQREPDERVVTIGFAGTSSHNPDLAMIEGALMRVAHRYGDRVRFVIWGATTENLRLLPNVREIKTAVGYTTFPQRLAGLNLDIGLAPLRDIPFNRAKSDLKWLEYSALGIPSVISDVPVFAEPKDRGLALVIPNDEDAWYLTLCRLIEDPNLRRALGTAARDYVWAHRTLERQVGAYGEILNRVLPEGLRLPRREIHLRNLPRPSEDDAYMDAATYRRWLALRQLREVDGEVYAENLVCQGTVPRIGIVSLVLANEAALLADTLDSLAGLLLDNWHLTIVSDVPAPDPDLDGSTHLSWVTVDNADDPFVWGEALNDAIASQGADFACVVPAGTRFQPESLVLVANYFARHPEWQALYTDHDWLDTAGRRFRPVFKPAFNLEYLRAFDYVGPAVFFRAEAVGQVGGVEPYQDHEPYELLLRIWERLGSAAIGHVPEPLLSLAMRGRNRHVADASMRVAVENHLARSGVAAEVWSGLAEGTVRIVYRHEQSPLVSVIIPTRNRVDLMRPCLDSIFELTKYPRFEVIVVDNQSDDPDLFRLYQEAEARYGSRFRVVKYDFPFNFSAQINLGARHAKGEVLVLFNNDCQIIDGLWMERMLHHALRGDVGAVGALLVAPETGEIQHAGIALGFPGGLESVADHLFSGESATAEGYMKRLQVDQEYSAVTAACMMVGLDRFNQVNGFDEENLAVLYNDVDFCLRLHERGYRNIFTPFARVMHRQGATLKEVTDDPARVLEKLVQEKKETEVMFARWLSRLANDPFISRHWALTAKRPCLDPDLSQQWNPDFHERPRVLGFPLPGGSGEYRVRIPLEGLSRTGRAHAAMAMPKGGMVATPSIVELRRKAPDALLLHSTVSATMESHVLQWKKWLPDTRFIFGMDDRLGEVPEKSSVYLSHQRHFPDARYRMRRILRHCDRAIVSTAPLADMIADMIGDVRVIPNALERERWEHLRPRRRVGAKPRIGWVGAQQHRGDLELILEVVAATHREVDWVFMGMWLPEFAGMVKEMHKFVPFGLYPEKMASLDLDLAVAPLESNAFNESKSNLRLLEYGALGYPVICTDIYPYRENAPPVTHLPNEPQTWIEAIRAKAADPEALALEGDTLREWVAEHYWMEHHLEAWNRALFE